MKRISVCTVGLAVLLLGLGCSGPRSYQAADPADPTSLRIALFGTNKVHYVVVGKGPETLVFVHGWACNSGFWREQLPAFASDARVILIDLPGHGRSDKPQPGGSAPAPYTMDFFAQAVLAVMQDAEVSRATLLGHSMGTPVICLVHALASEKVAALVAIDGLLRRPAFTPEQGEKFIGPYRTEAYREHAAKFIDSMFPHPGTEALRDEVRAEMLRTPQYVMASAMEGMFGTGQPAWDLPPLQIPVMSLNAKNPMWTSEYEAYVRSLSPKTDYRVMEGVGHFLMLENAAEFNAILRDMLRKFDLIRK